jgi:hypothetical protein
VSFPLSPSAFGCMFVPFRPFVWSPAIVCFFIYFVSFATHISCVLCASPLCATPHAPHKQPSRKVDGVVAYMRVLWIMTYSCSSRSRLGPLMEICGISLPLHVGVAGTRCHFKNIVAPSSNPLEDRLYQRNHRHLLAPFNRSR